MSGCYYVIVWAILIRFRADFAACFDDLKILISHWLVLANHGIMSLDLGFSIIFTVLFDNQAQEPGLLLGRLQLWCIGSTWRTFKRRWLWWSCALRLCRDLQVLAWFWPDFCLFQLSLVEYLFLAWAMLTGRSGCRTVTEHVWDDFQFLVVCVGLCQNGEAGLQSPLWVHKLVELPYNNFFQGARFLIMKGR